MEDDKKPRAVRSRKFILDEYRVAMFFVGFVYMWPFLYGSFSGVSSAPEKTYWLSDHLERRFIFSPDHFMGELDGVFRVLVSKFYSGLSLHVQEGVLKESLFEGLVLKSVRYRSDLICRSEHINASRYEAGASMFFSPLFLSPVSAFAEINDKPGSQADYPVTILFFKPNSTSDAIFVAVCGKYVVFGSEEYFEMEGAL